MRSKISRNDDKVPNKQRNENELDNSISILLNIHKKYNHIKLRVKENKPNRQRPRAPHNTTQYLSQIYHENRISQDMISKMSNNQLNNENTNVIENFLITGGSLKGKVKL